MGVKYLLDLLQSNTIPDGVVEVDLFRVAKESLSSSSSAAAAIATATATATATAGVGSSSSSSSKSKFCLVVDGECCLNRLYGGFYSDWICGGQWNRMADFLDKLVSSAQKADIELTVFFNGAIEPQRMNEWIVQQKQEYGKIQKIFFHVSKFGVAPSNKLWIAPVGLRMALRMMLRHKNVNVVSTIDDYRQEVIAYCRENNIHGLVTDDAEYMAFDPPRLFSASKLKLRFKGTLESQEFVVSALLKELQLSNEKLCVLMALLGNYLLSDKDLGDVYKAANIESAAEENTAESVIRKLARYLNELNVCTNDLDETAIRILGAADDDHVRRSALKQSIQYYLDGTKDGFFKYRSVCSSVCASAAAAAAAADADTIATTTAAGDVGASIGSVSERGDNYDNEDVQITVRSLLSYEPDLDTSKLASENVSCEKNLLNAYKEAQSCFTNAAGPHDDQLSVVSAATANGSSTVNGFADIIADVITPLTNERTTSTTRTMDSIGEEREMEMRKEENRKPVGDILPSVPHEVMRTVSERHSKGLMSPYIYQILSQGEIKLPVIVEDIKQNLSIYSFFKPIRQMVYAIVFNLHHRTYMACKNNAAVPTSIRIKEWIFNPVVQTHQAEYVEAEAVGWRVPTIQRLWFGTTQDDKRRRLRAFLTCMRSDVQLLLNPEFVPQQLLVAAVVLRYMMSFADKKVLRKPELDAFIVAALAPEFNVPNFIQELKIPQLSCRGVHLAAMFMKGVEMAMLVNDACGAPIPWLMCCPWLFFDGKLFHHMFVKAISVKNLHELCDNRVGLVMRAERMRQAILEGLNVQFARPPLSAAAAAATTTTLSPRSHIASSPPPPPQQLPPTPEELKSTSYANSLHRSPFTNYHHQRRHHHHHQQQQHQPHPNHDHHHDNQRNRRRHHQHHHPHHYYHHHHHLQHQHQHQHRHYHRTRMPVASCASNGGNNLARSLTCTTGVGLARPTRSLGGRLEIAGVVVGSWGANYNLSRSTPYDSAAAATYLVPPPPPQLPLPSSRQIGPAVRNNYHQHQFTAGYRAAPTAALLSPSQRSAFVSARSASRNIKPSFVKKKLCNEERTMVKGKGRGLVIDTTSCTAKSFSLSSAASSSSSFCGDTATATATTTTSTATAAVVVTFTPTPIATDAASSTMATVLATSISADDADCDAEMTKAKINEKTTNAADGDTMLLIGQGDSGVSDVKSIHEASKSLVEAISE